jgi:hypothetical protein
LFEKLCMLRGGFFAAQFFVPLPYDDQSAECSKLECSRRSSEQSAICQVDFGGILRRMSLHDGTIAKLANLPAALNAAAIGVELAAF